MNLGLPICSSIYGGLQMLFNIEGRAWGASVRFPLRFQAFVVLLLIFSRYQGWFQPEPFLARSDRTPFPSRLQNPTLSSQSYNSLSRRKWRSPKVNRRCRSSKQRKISLSLTR
ncbi:hypothetical protein NE237_016852 [Protea cynaroides]|uniref:Uncharacterized protein n=1 Tax=Protea cynaroides TaxID=273540 RepID=A0A9Q0HHQ5_9MAGN|nr:hypothetical protein NE237_016852 [Protea cynaroides]